MLTFKYEQVGIFFLSPNGFQKKSFLQQTTNLCQGQASRCVSGPFSHLRRQCATWIGIIHVLCVIHTEEAQEERHCRTVSWQRLSEWVQQIRLIKLRYWDGESVFIHLKDGVWLLKIKAFFFFSVNKTQFYSYLLKTSFQYSCEKIQIFSKVYSRRWEVI